MSPVPSHTMARLREALERVALPDRPEIEAERLRAIEGAAALDHRRRRRLGERLPPLRLLCGPSGGGKSSLFNAVLGRELSRVSSIERPATRGAIAALGEGAADLEIMPTLALVARESHPGGAALSLVRLPAPALGRQVMIDCPDYDSREDRNRDLVDRILPWADELILVSSLERYGDRSAEPLLRRCRRLGIPLIAVLNKNEGPAEDALADFLARIRDLGGPEPMTSAALARRPGGIDPEAPVVAALRRPPAGAGPADPPLVAEIVAAVRTPLLEALDDWRRAVAALRDDLDGLLLVEDELRDDGRMRKLEDYEQESKFWLRYSPRGLLRGLREVVRDPGRIFRSTEVPREPEEQALLELVLEQARRVEEGMRVRACEILKRHRPGRLLVESGALAARPEDDEALVARMRPIAQGLHEFGRARIEAFRREWAEKNQGFLGRARFWAVDKVLRLLGLCLTFAVLPPLLWELLRFIGHPAFTNEVAAEFHRARAAFRDAMAEIETESIARTMTAVAELGPSSAAIDELRAALDAVAEEEDGR